MVCIIYSNRNEKLTGPKILSASRKLHMLSDLLDNADVKEETIKIQRIIFDTLRIMVSIVYPYTNSAQLYKIQSVIPKRRIYAIYDAKKL